MTLQDEARDLLRQKRAAEDELAAVRREINEAVAARGGHADRATAEELTIRLSAAVQRKHEIEMAIAALNADC